MVSVKYLMNSKGFVDLPQQAVTWGIFAHGRVFGKYSLLHVRAMQTTGDSRVPLSESSPCILQSAGLLSRNRLRVRLGRCGGVMSNKGLIVVDQLFI